MPGFDAAKIVDPLDFDFTKFGGPKGTITEPSDGALEKYVTAVKAAIADARAAEEKDGDGEADEDDAKPVELFDGWDENIVLVEQLTEASVAVCGGTPDEEQIRALPLRAVRPAFLWWLLRELTYPEAVAAGGNDSPAAPNAASNGTGPTASPGSTSG